VTVPLLARPASAAGAAPTHSAEPPVARLLSRVWSGVVEHLPFLNATAADQTDRGADLDPMGLNGATSGSETDRSAALDPMG
jgi:hypothetical protein